MFFSIDDYIKNQKGSRLDQLPRVKLKYIFRTNGELAPV